MESTSRNVRCVFVRLSVTIQLWDPGSQDPNFLQLLNIKFWAHRFLSVCAPETDPLDDTASQPVPSGQNPLILNNWTLYIQTYLIYINFCFLNNPWTLPKLILFCLLTHHDDFIEVKRCMGSNSSQGKLEDFPVGCVHNPAEIDGGYQGGMIQGQPLRTITAKDMICVLRQISDLFIIHLLRCFLQPACSIFEKGNK